MQQCIKILFIFIRSSTCFGPHTAHHQEPKTALAASGFAYVEGCWTYSWWTSSGSVCLTAWHCPPTFHVWKTRGCQCSFRLLMMGGVSPETCWASYKYGIMKFWYTVASCWIFLYELCYDAWIHEHEASGLQGYDAISIGRVATLWETLLFPSAGSEYCT